MRPMRHSPSEQDGARWRELQEIVRSLVQGMGDRTASRESLRRMRESDPDLFAALMRNLRAAQTHHNAEADLLADFLLRDEPERSGLLGENEVQAVEEALRGDPELAGFARSVRSELPQWRGLLESVRKSLASMASEPSASAGAAAASIPEDAPWLVAAPQGWAAEGALGRPYREEELNRGLRLGRWRLGTESVAGHLHLGLDTVGRPSLEGFRLTLPADGKPLGTLRLDVEAHPARRDEVTLVFLLESWSSAESLKLELGDAEQALTGRWALVVGLPERIPHSVRKGDLSQSWLHLSWGPHVEIVPLPVRPAGDGVT